MYCTNCGKENTEIANFCYYCGKQLNQSSSGDRTTCINGVLNDHEWADLGLRVKWATCNIGANRPSDYGNYYEWGNTAPKTNHIISNKPLRLFSVIAGIPDYDVALSQWGSGWRLPTKADFEDLISNCIWRRDTQYGIDGYKVIGSNGNSIFLPFGGAVDIDEDPYDKQYKTENASGYFWSSTKDIEFSQWCGDSAYCLSIDSINRRVGPGLLNCGLSVRPVCDNNIYIHCLHCGNRNLGNAKYCYYCGNTIDHSTKLDTSTIVQQGCLNGQVWVDLGLSVKWAACNVGANNPSDYGDYYAWGEIITKSSYSVENYSLLDQKLNDISGSIKYDAATVKWGKAWRIPTYQIFNELLNYCNWEWCVVNSHYGYKITGPSGASIFLPAAGNRCEDLLRGTNMFGSYWCSTVHWLGGAESFGFYSDKEDFSAGAGDYFGNSIRPVCD